MVGNRELGIGKSGTGTGNSDGTAAADATTGSMVAARALCREATWPPAGGELPRGRARAIRIAGVPFVPISGPAPADHRYDAPKYPRRWLPPRIGPVRPGSLSSTAPGRADISQYGRHAHA